MKLVYSKRNIGEMEKTVDGAAPYYMCVWGGMGKGLIVIKGVETQDQTDKAEKRIIKVGESCWEQQGSTGPEATSCH